MRGFDDVARDEVCAAVAVLPAVTGQHKDRSAACGSAAEYVAVLVANEPGFFRRDAVIAARLLDHSRTGFSPVGGMIGMVRGKVGGIDRSAKLAEKFRVDRLVVGDGEIAAPDAALIGDDDIEPATTAEFRKSIWRRRGWHERARDRHKNSLHP